MASLRDKAEASLAQGHQDAAEHGTQAAHLAKA